MARSINRVTLFGYTADEPVVRTFGQDSKVANVTVVTNESTRNSQTGEWEDIPEWHRVVAWGRLADVVANYVHKGQRLYVEGRLKTHSYTDNSGVKRKSTEIIANEVIFGDSRRDGDQGQGQGQYQNSRNGGYQNNNYGNRSYNNNNGGGYGQSGMPYGQGGGNQYGNNSNQYSNGGGQYGNGGNGQYSNGGSRYNNGQSNAGAGYGDWRNDAPQSNPPYGSDSPYGGAQANAAPQEPGYQGFGGYAQQSSAPAAASSAPTESNYSSPYGNSEPAPAAAPAPTAPAPSSAPVAPAAPVPSSDAGDDEIPF